MTSGVTIAFDDHTTGSFGPIRPLAIRAVLDEYPERTTVGEVYLLDPLLIGPYYGTAAEPELHLSFNFAPMLGPWPGQRQGRDPAPTARPRICPPKNRRDNSRAGAADRPRESRHQRAAVRELLP